MLVAHIEFAIEQQKISHLIAPTNSVIAKFTGVVFAHHVVSLPRQRVLKIQLVTTSHLYYQKVL